MTGFEGIVRPFQTPDYTPRATTQAEVPAAEPIVVTIGNTGKGFTFNGNFSSTQTLYMEATVKEKSRETETHRVFNPDDNTQYVDVEAINTLETDGNNGTNFQETKFEYDNTAATGDY